MKLSGDNGVIKHFLLDVEVRKRSPHTLDRYRRSLNRLVALLQSLNVTELEQVTVIHLRQCVQRLLTDPLPTGRSYRIPLNGSTLSIASVRNHIREWKVFFGWCQEEGLIEKNPTARLALPNPEKRITVTFTDEHIQEMLACCDTSTEIGFRDYVILLLLLDTGMRLSEIAGLRVTDIYDTYVKVYGKGRKEREIGIHPHVGKLLWKYINKYRHPKDEHEQALFMGGSRSSGKPLGYGGVKQVLERVKEATGIDSVRLSAHTFRHTFAKMYLEEGGEVFKLSREMGHSSVQVTKLYLEDFTSTEARKEHTSFSPINRLSLKKQSQKSGKHVQYKRKDKQEK
jgi:integrase/recombinase XerD